MLTMKPGRLVKMLGCAPGEFYDVKFLNHSVLTCRTQIIIVHVKCIGECLTWSQHSVHVSDFWFYLNYNTDTAEMSQL